jgi:phage terminase large subunit
VSAVLAESFDYLHPDYLPVLVERDRRLRYLRADPIRFEAAKIYYRTHIARFIIDWGVTTDPRNLEIGVPTTVPFLLFPKQIQWCEWIIDSWQHRLPGITEKTRQMGFSWLSMSLSCSLCLFNDGMVIGVGSRKQDYVDVIGDPKSLIEKARMFMRGLPEEFRGGWQDGQHAPHMRLMFPGSGSILIGESGDELGRGNSTSIYFVDEAAYLEHPLVVDRALSQTTNCRQDISTPNGMANSFAQRRFSLPADRVFTFHWRDDPRKDQAWYDKQVRELDPVIVAAEIDINYAASVEGVVIPSAWVQAAIGADAKLGFECTGESFAALDVADEGKDKNCLGKRVGVKLTHLKSWSGAGSTIFKTVQRTFGLLDEWEQETFDYDADGLGAGVRGDAEQINEAREREGRPRIRDNPFRGSAAVYQPESEMVKKRKNKDYFQNLKAQSWWALRLRFEKTYKAVVDGERPFNQDELIVIDPALPELTALTMELSQPTWEKNLAGKIVIDKVPEGALSPNRGDMVMILYNPSTRHFELMRRLGM